VYACYGQIRLYTVATNCALESDKKLNSIPHHSVREITWLISLRGAVKLDYLLLRRTQIALHGYTDEQCLTELAFIMANVLVVSNQWATKAVKTCLNTAVFQAIRANTI